MIYGVTEQGFIRKRLPECIAERQEAYRAEFGNIRTDPESRFGQIIGIEAKNEADIWEQMENVYYSAFPNSAEGISLDNTLLFNRLTRLRSTQSEVMVGVCGNNPDINKLQLSRAFQIRSTNNDLFNCDSDVLRANENIDLLAANFRIKDVADNTAYIIRVNTATVSFTTGTNATAAAIVAGLFTAFQAVKPAGAELTKGEDFIRLYSIDTSFHLVSISTNLRLYHDVKFLSDAFGQIPVSFGSLSIIETPAYGVEAVFNFVDGILGRERETDEEARIRREDSLQASGGATIEAMRTRLRQEVPNVRNVMVVPNDTDAVDGEGRAPHSVEFIITGGDGEEIARKILEIKGAGIATNGKNVFSIPDSEGFLHQIRFNRPAEKEVYILATIRRDTTGTFPTEGVQTIKQNLIKYGGTLGIGQDVLAQRLLTEFYKVAGIEEVDLKVGTTPSVTGEKVVVLSNEYATIEDTNGRIIITIL